MTNAEDRSGKRTEAPRTTCSSRMINFRVFCASEKDNPLLSEPFSVGNYTYATDGRIGVRLPLCNEVPEGDEMQAKRAKALDRLFAVRLGVQTPEAFERQLPDPPEGDDCERCEGSGMGHNDCPCCDCDCCDCNGTGTCLPTQRIRFETFDVNVKHLRLVLALPNPKIAIDVSNGDGPLLFTFDGGVGLLMPMRQENHIDDEIFKVSDLVHAKTLEAAEETA